MSKLTNEKLKSILVSKKGYLRWSNFRISNKFNVTEKVAEMAKVKAKTFLNNNNIQY